MAKAAQAVSKDLAPEVSAGFMIDSSSYDLERTQKEIILLLGQLGEGAFSDDDDIIQKGRKMVLPEGMAVREAVDFLRLKIREAEKETYFQRDFKYRPLDGAACMFRAMKRVFGSVGHRGKMGFFGEMRPEMRSVPVGVGETEQIPWGRFSLPFLPDTLFETNTVVDNELGPLFRLSATGPKMFATQIEGVFNIVAEELAQNSIYRGQAIDGRDEPEFVDLSGIDPSKVIYTEDVYTQLEASVWAQLKYTDEMKARGVPLKRSVLVHGPFGTGKTLAAGITGQIAVKHGWTYIKARPGRDDFLAVLQTARLYQPAVVFCEDVDTVSDATDNQATITRLLDEFDGIDAKDTQILCVLTSNHPERIHKGMLRPGRLDAVIKIDALDHEGIEKMIKAVIEPELLDTDIVWDSVGDAMDMFKPAFVREAADRAVRYAIVRGKGRPDTKLNTDDFVNAASGLRPQLEMMEGASDTAQRDNVGESVARLVTPLVMEEAKKAVRENIREDLLAPEVEAPEF